MAEAQGSKINHEEILLKVEDLEKRLQTKDAEIQVYKMLMSQMEEEVAQAKKIKLIHDKQNQDVDNLKVESEKTLTKAKGLIFDKIKIIKNQELQIEAFVQQIESLKEVVRITKDLLEIRNMEVAQLEIKISSMEGKQKAEKERYDLMHKKLEMMIRHNGELKREYETQLCLFTALRERYSERELAKGVIENLKNENSTDTVVKSQPAVESNDKVQEVSKDNKIQDGVAVGDEKIINNDTVAEQESLIKIPDNTEEIVNKIESSVVTTSSEQNQEPVKTVDPEPIKTVDPVSSTVTNASETETITNSTNATAEIQQSSQQDLVKNEQPANTVDPVTSTINVNTDSENITTVVDKSVEQDLIKNPELAKTADSVNSTNLSEVKAESAPVTELAVGTTDNAANSIVKTEVLTQNGTQEVSAATTTHSENTEKKE